MLEVTQDNKPQFTVARSAEGATRLVIVYYERLTTDAITHEIESLIREGIRKSISEDSALRQKVHEAISAAAMAMPLDAIAAAVKQAVSELKQDSATRSPEPPKGE